MKKVFTLLVALAFVGVIVTAAWAGGDKVRGEKGKGAVEQHQIRN